MSSRESLLPVTIWSDFAPMDGEDAGGKNGSMKGSYKDAKGRERWSCNDALAQKLKELHDVLVIGNYEESHAARYPRLAHMISRHAESIEVMDAEGRIAQLPGVSEVIEEIISEFLATGTCRKMEFGDEFFSPPPRSVLELTKIPRLGAKTARTLYQEHGISSLRDLGEALEEGRLAEVKGIGKGMEEAIRRSIDG